MKVIRLLRDIPVAKKHGMREGRVLEALETKKSPLVAFWVVGDADDPIGVHKDEAEVIAEPVHTA